MTVVGTLLLVVLAVAPGLALLLPYAWEKRDDEERWALWVAAIVVSVAVVVVVALMGLVLGQLLWALVVLGLLGLAGITLRLRGRDPWALVHPPRDLWSLASRVVVAAIPLSLLATPLWNFQIANGMDAGNYEVVSNWYATTGSYYYDADPALALESVSSSWVFSPGNTFGSSPPRQYYFPGFPVLLGVVKHLTGQIDVSSLVNIALSALTVLILWQIARALGASRTAAAVVVAVTSVTLMSLYYSKQIMAEQIGLLGAATMAWAVIDRRIPRGGAVLLGASGVVLALLSKTDGYQVVLLLLAGVALAGRFDLRARAIGAGMLAATWGSSLVLIWLAVPSYLNHLRFPRIGPLRLDVSGAQFVLIAMGMITVWAAACWYLPRGWTRVPAHTFRRIVERAAQALVALLVVVGLWMLLLRHRGLDVEEAVDAFNLLRLAEVWSPVALVAIFTGVAFASKRLHDTTRIVALFLTLTLVSLLVESRHSPPELWWMRRYVMAAAPIGVIALTALWQTIRARVPRLPHLTAAAALSVVAIGLAWQVTVLAPLYRQEQNPGLVQSLQLMLEAVGDEQPVLVAAVGPDVRGVGNALRTLRSGPTVPAVPWEEVLDVAEGIDEPVAVILPPCTPDRLLPGNIERVGSWASDAGWVNRRPHLDPDRRHRFHVAWQALQVTPGPPIADLTGYVEPGDQSGVFYWLGTRGDRCAWENPATTGIIEASISGQFGGETGAANATDQLPGTTLSELVHTLSEPGSSYQVDLGAGRELEPTRVTLKQREDTRFHLVREFRLEGSRDGASWTTLLESNHPGEQGEWASFPLDGDDPAYRHFRLGQTGPDSQGEHYLVFAQIELYGRLTVEGD